MQVDNVYVSEKPIVERGDNMDFAQLRQNIFETEEADAIVDTPVRDELRKPSVGFPLLLGIGSVALWAFDRFSQNGELLEKEGEYNYRPLVTGLLGLLPLGFGLGQLTRGLASQEELEKYEQLVATAEEEMEKLESEIVEMEQKNAEEAQKSAAESSVSIGGVDFFMNADTGVGTATQGVYGAAFGQQPIAMRPDFQNDVFGF